MVVVSANASARAAMTLEVLLIVFFMGFPFYSGALRLFWFLVVALERNSFLISETKFCFTPGARS